jgi:hypothetical protein
MSVRLTIQSRALARVRAPHRRATGLAVAACALLFVAAVPTPALAVSTRDLIELSKAGLGDDVLVALIEADGTVFNLDAPKILELRDAGVSERVITAMLRNATRPAPDAASAAMEAHGAAAPPPAPAEHVGAPYFVIIGEKPPAAEPPTQPTYYLPWIPWAGIQAHPVRPARPARPTMEYRGFGRFINDGWVDNTRR